MKKNATKTVLIMSVLTLLLGSLASCCLIGLLFVWPRHRINHDSFAKLQGGMTEKEVESILGGPAGRYVEGPMIHGEPGRFVHYAKKEDLQNESKSWVTSSLEIGVTFDREGRLGKKWICEMRRPQNYYGFGSD